MTVPRVLFVTDNGHGLGHLTRLLAVARKANGRFQPLFLTLSEAYPVLRDAGVPVEYLPSYTKLRLARHEWQPLFAHRLLSILNHVQPRAVVVDHISPPAVIGEIKAKSAGIEWIWSRRGMWRKGYNTQAMELSGNFDMIVEPSDVAAPTDVGVTTYDRDRVVVVPPVILVPPDDQLSRDEARAGLGLPVTGRAVLIQLSDSDPERLASMVGQVRDVIREVADDDVSLFAPLHVLHKGRLPEIEGVMMRPVYPVARYLQAFDAVVSTAGYNSYHEVVASGVPAVFIARDTRSLDDQRRRAEFAHLCGRAFFAQSPYESEFRDSVERALRVGEGDIARAVTRELGSFDGARVMADLLAKRVASRRWEAYTVPEKPALGTSALGAIDFPSGSVLDGGGSTNVRRVGYVLVGMSAEDVRQLVERVRLEQLESGDFKPVFLVEDVDPDIFSEPGFQFETVLSPAEWDNVGTNSHQGYLRQRVDTFPLGYQLSEVVDFRRHPVGSDSALPM